MNWINPPDSVRRFTVHQVVQHWIAAALGGVLVLTAGFFPFPGGGAAAEIHVVAGTIGAAFLVYHFVMLLSTAVRSDVPAEKVAFLPFAAAAGGKFAPGERWDYLLILCWSLCLAVSGTVLRWPGRLWIPGPRTFYWIKIFHAGCGAAWVMHMLTAHVPARWLRAAADFRRAIFTGMVPLPAVEERPGWVSDLVAAGALVPVPAETLPDERRESLQVRDLLEEGNRLAREGRYEEAASAFEQAIRLYPEYAQARFNLAVARMRQGRGDLAEEQFRAFIEVDPFNPMAEKARDLLREIAAERTGGKDR